MSITSISGGTSHNVTVFGNGTVIAGSGNVGVDLIGSGKVLVGSGRDTITVWGNSTVSAGSGNDRIDLLGPGQLTVGGGQDTLALGSSAHVTQIGREGHDTISLGYGNDTISVQGFATVRSGAFTPFLTIGHDPDGPYYPGPGFRETGTAILATIAGGELMVNHTQGITEEIAVSGRMTLMGGNSATEFVGGKGSVLMLGGSGHDTFVGGSGHDTMTGVGNHNVFEILASQQGGQHLITNFVSGDVLEVEGHTLSYLEAHNEVTTRDGNTYISIDGGKTTIELQGWTEPGYKAPHPHGPSFER